MKVQEVIENLKYLISDDCTDTQSDYVEEIELAIKALEKQIAKKPTDVCTLVITWGLCPACKGELNTHSGQPNRVFESDNFCLDCGQALDWSDEE